MSRAVLVVLLVGIPVLCVDSAYGQTKGQTPAPTPAPSPGAGTRTPTPSPTPTPTTPGQQQQPGMQQQNPFSQQPIFLSGKVMLEDGTPLSEPASIDLVCGGIHKRQAWTDSKGRFSFQVGENRVMPDASEGSYGGFGRFGESSSNTPGNTRTVRNLMGCELVADLAGFRSDSVNLENRRGLDNPEVGTIVLHRIAGVEGTTISATTLEAPKDAKKAFEKGTKAAGKEKWDEARKELEKAVEVYPKYAAAWYELGQVYRQEQKPDQARTAFAQALNADAKYVKPLAQLSQMAVQEQKWQDVVDTTDKLLRLDRFSYPVAYYYNSLAYFQLHNLDAAEKSAREGLKVDPGHRFPKTNHLLGVILANKGTYEEAAQNMRSYLQYAPAANDTAIVKKQLSELEKKTGVAKGPEPQE